MDNIFNKIITNPSIIKRIIIEERIDLRFFLFYFIKKNLDRFELQYPPLNSISTNLIYDTLSCLSENDLNDKFLVNDLFTDIKDEFDNNTLFGYWCLHNFCLHPRMFLNLEIIQFFLYKGLKLDSQNYLFKFLSGMCFIEDDLDPNHLQFDTLKNLREVLNLFVKKGGYNLSEKTDYGNVLHIFCGNYFGTNLEVYKIVFELLSNQSNINATDKWDKTCFEIAIHRHINNRVTCSRLIEFFISQGCYFNSDLIDYLFTHNYSHSLGNSLLPFLTDREMGPLVLTEVLYTQKSFVKKIMELIFK